MSRPFCQDGFKIQKEETPMKKGPPSVEKAKNITVLDGSCSCDKCPRGGEADTVPDKGSDSDERRKYEEKSQFEIDVLDTIWSVDYEPPAITHTESHMDENNGKRKRRDISTNNNNKLEQESMKHQDDKDTFQSTVLPDNTEKNTFQDVMVQKNNAKHGYLLKVRRKVYGSNLTVSHLKHFGSYSLQIRACHTIVDDKTKNSMELLHPACSSDAWDEFQVLPDLGADNIMAAPRLILSPGGQEDGNNEEDMMLDTDGKHQDETDLDLNGKEGNLPHNKKKKGERKFITWDPPKDPNLLIVNYYLQYTFTNDKSGSEHDLRGHCVTAKDFNLNQQ